MDGVEGLKATARSKMRRSSSRFKRSMLNTAAPMTYHAAHEARGRMDAQLPRQLLLLLQRSVTGEVVYAGEQGGFHVLEIKPEGGRTAKVFLDAKTFLTARQEKLEGDCIQTLGLADWRGVEGVMFPFETRQSAGDAKYDALFHVQEVFLNEAYDDALFTELPQTIPPLLAEGSVSLPFELSSNHIYVTGQVGNSRPLNIFIDTGAVVSVANSRTARELGWSDRSRTARGQGRR